MSATNFPDAIFKRDVLYGARKVSVDQLTKLGNDFESGGWTSDAVDFLAQAKDTEGLKRIRAKSVEEGDTFLFLKASRSLGDLDSVSDQLRICCENAAKAGKIRYAIKGYEKLGDEARADALRATVADDGDIKAEAAAKKVFIPEHELEVENESADAE